MKISYSISKIAGKSHSKKRVSVSCFYPISERLLGSSCQVLVSCSVFVTFGFVLRQDRSPTIEMVINELLQWWCKYKVFGDLINEP